MHPLNNWLWGPPIPITTSAPSIDLTIVQARPLTPEERFEQKVSFVYGQLKDTGLTKEQVRAVLSF